MKTVLLVLSIMLFCNLALADYQQGLDAYNSGDYATALREWKPLAEQGNASSQHILGFMYQKGKGVTQDYGDAMRWYKLAAEQGYAESQHNLGWLYNDGIGVKRDDKTAMRWYKLAAEQGYAKSQHKVGYMYDKGFGVNQDSRAAAKWYKLAADQGYAAAQHNMGLMYYHGKGVSLDYDAAFKWFNLAAEQGFSSSQINLGVFYGNGISVRRDNIQAHMWLDIAASLGNKLAAQNLYEFQKKMTPADISKAKDLAGTCVSMNFKGCSPTSNSFKFYEAIKAAEAGDSIAALKHFIKANPRFKNSKMHLELQEEINQTEFEEAIKARNAEELERLLSEYIYIRYENRESLINKAKEILSRNGRAKKMLEAETYVIVVSTDLLTPVFYVEKLNDVHPLTLRAVDKNKWTIRQSIYELAVHEMIQENLIVWLEDQLPRRYVVLKKSSLIEGDMDLSLNFEQRVSISFVQPGKFDASLRKSHYPMKILFNYSVTGELRNAGSDERLWEYTHEAEDENMHPEINTNEYFSTVFSGDAAEIISENLERYIEKN